jgi:hypothetical protein
MAFSSEHKWFIIESYFRNGIFNNEEYSVVSPSFDKNFQI